MQLVKSPLMNSKENIINVNNQWKNLASFIVDSLTDAHLIIVHDDEFQGKESLTLLLQYQ